VTDTARVLLTAAVLASSGFGVFAWRIVQLEASAPERLIGQLRLGQFAAMTLALLGGIPIGLAIGARPEGLTHFDAVIGLAFAAVAAYVLRQDPRGALGLAAAAFIVHALLNLAHQPGWLQADLSPRWFTIGCATLDVYMAGLCYWARRR
jgi:hypothetical protein